MLLQTENEDEDEDEDEDGEEDDEEDEESEDDEDDKAKSDYIPPGEPTMRKDRVADPPGPLESFFRNLWPGDKP